MRLIKGFPATTNDEYQLNCINILKHTATYYPKQEIVSRVDGDIFRYNYAEAYKRVQRLANALVKLGVKPGDKVGVIGWNTH